MDILPLHPGGVCTIETEERAFSANSNSVPSLAYNKEAQEQFDRGMCDMRKRFDPRWRLCSGTVQGDLYKRDYTDMCTR